MITLTIRKPVNIGLLSYMYKYLIFCGQFASVTVTFVSSFLDSSVCYFQNLRDCLTGDLYPVLAVEERLKETNQTVLM